MGESEYVWGVYVWVFDCKVISRVFYGFLVGFMSVWVTGGLLGFLEVSLRVYNMVYVSICF